MQEESARALDKQAEALSLRFLDADLRDEVARVGKKVRFAGDDSVESSAARSGLLRATDVDASPSNDRLPPLLPLLLPLLHAGARALACPRCRLVSPPGFGSSHRKAAFPARPPQAALRIVRELNTMQVVVVVVVLSSSSSST